MVYDRETLPFYALLCCFVADVDFSQVSETVTFNIGDSRMCIDITILGDDLPEPTERFPLQLVSSDVDIGQSSAIVTINDDDIPGKKL